MGKIVDMGQNKGSYSCRHTIPCTACAMRERHSPCFNTVAPGLLVVPVLLACLNQVCCCDGPRWGFGREVRRVSFPLTSRMEFRCVGRA